MTFGELFAGIGGFGLGLERAGMRCKWQVEIDHYAARVLEKNWAGVERFADVRDFTPTEEKYVDVICGGFPCQDISLASRTGAGISGKKSGLWSEFSRIIGLARPKYVIIENSPVLSSRGLDRVLADLATLGYDAEWSVVPASAVGAPHRRDRLWIVAYANCEHDAMRGDREDLPEGVACRESDTGGSLGDCWQGCEAESGQGACDGPATIETTDWWEAEPDVDRVADGVPHRVDRLRCLGNAVVPQIVEQIGRLIMAKEEKSCRG